MTVSKNWTMFDIDRTGQNQAPSTDKPTVSEEQ